ncbi:MAG: hypothetical protein ACE5J7_03780 [Candidatus Aenigmatarchaeota archaeon]
MWKRKKTIDKEIRCAVDAINEYTDYETLSSCSGHGRYPMTIIVRNKSGRIFDLISGKDIPRKRNFYKKDKEGYYYIPEVSEKR